MKCMKKIVGMMLVAALVGTTGCASIMRKNVNDGAYPQIVTNSEAEDVEATEISSDDRSAEEEEVNEEGTVGAEVAETEAETEAEALEAGYHVYIVDAEGAFVPDVTLLMCDDDTCSLFTTDQDGYVYAPEGNGRMEVHVYFAPEGYTFDDSITYVAESGKALYIDLSATAEDKPQGMLIQEEVPGQEASSSSADSATTDSATTRTVASDLLSSLSISFSTTDKQGSAVTSDIFADYTLTVINLWEPWCGPCVGEMPDLEQLYQDYKEKGVNFIGVYETESDSDNVIRQTGVTYPILHYSSDFDMMSYSGYVPVTIVVDSNGNLLYLDGVSEGASYYTSNPSTSEEEYYNCVAIGSRSYSNWAEFLDRVLQ